MKATGVCAAGAGAAAPTFSDHVGMWVSMLTTRSIPWASREPSRARSAISAPRIVLPHAGAQLQPQFDEAAHSHMCSIVEAISVDSASHALASAQEARARHLELGKRC